MLLSAILSVAGPIFWGIVTFSILVFVHEGGHFLAARACGVRVSEFFLGMPCSVNIHHVSRRIGTKFGITPLLLGGYAQICGMEPVQSPHLAAVLGAVHRRGRASTGELASELHISEQEALDACVELMGWGSLAPVYDVEAGERPGGAYYPTTYAAMPRDAAGATIYDGRGFNAVEATAEGEPWEPVLDDEAFLAQERSRTYAGQGFFKRAAMLVAGIAVNIVTGLLLLVIVYAVLGFDVAVDSNTIGSVTEGSAAESIGLVAGDTITALDGEAVESWTDIIAIIGEAEPGQQIEVTYEHEGASVTAVAVLDEDGLLGVGISYVRYRAGLLQSLQLAVAYVAATAEAVVQLLIPSQTMEVLENSTSIVGISVMSAEYAAEGASTYLAFVALISFSLAFMNLLPIPPLDGGKLLIEVVQAILRREVPPKVQTGISYAGLALFGILFIYLLQNDIVTYLL